MFNRYTLKYKTEQSERPIPLYFYTYSKGTRGGFYHLARVVGRLPDREGAPKLYATESLEYCHRLRGVKVNYYNRTWESYPGQLALQRLWRKLSKSKYLDMSKVAKRNPFGSAKEPKHEAIPTPEEVFR